MTTIQNVCVFGVGGVGGFFGAKMADAVTKMNGTGIKIYFIARGEHLDTIQSKGLTLKTSETTVNCRPFMATDDMTHIPSPDLILLCVKSYDLQNALAAIKPSINEDTILLPLLNGADIYDRIRQTIQTGTVLPACVYVGTHIASPGVIQQSGGDGKILLGNDPQKLNFSPQMVIDFFEAVGIDYRWQEDPFPDIWGKYLFITAFGMVSVYKNQSVGQIMDDDESRSLLKSIVQEIFSIATSKGVQLNEDIVQQTIAKGTRFPFETKTSYQRDVEHKGRLNEGDIYGETIIRLGKSLGVPTPVTQRIHQQITYRSEMR